MKIMLVDTFENGGGKNKFMKVFLQKKTVKESPPFNIFCIPCIFGLTYSEYAI